MRDRNYFAYIITNPGCKTLYTGVTNDLEIRILQHFNARGTPCSFAGRYHCYNLLYFERFELVEQAIAHEKEIKGWSRSKKLDLVKKENPEMHFLNSEVMQWPPEEDQYKFPLSSG